MTIFGWMQHMRAEEEAPLGQLIAKFGRMIVNARHSFDLATDAYLVGADAETVNRDVTDTDENINALHREIRRGLVIHASIRGAGELPFSLVMMSVAKDAELIGDYAKHICKLALTRPKAQGDPYFEHLLALKSQVSTALGDARELYETEDVDGAHGFVARAEVIKDECDAKTQEILTSREPRTLDPADPAATILCYRYYRRIVSHALNIVTSIVLPVDYLDYFDEDKDTRGPAPITRKKKRKKKDKKGKGKKKNKKRKK